MGKREDIKSIIKEIFAIENSALRKIIERLNHLNILEDIKDQESIQEDLATFNQVSYTVPSYGFIYHSFFRNYPHLSYLSKTNNRLERQVRLDLFGSRGSRINS